MQVMEVAVSMSQHVTLSPAVDIMVQALTTVQPTTSVTRRLFQQKHLLHVNLTLTRICISSMPFYDC